MTRKSIHIPGFKHRNPIPNAAVIGNVLESGVITGVDPGTGEMPDDLETQTKNAFGHMRAIMEAAGGSTNDILKVSVWLADPDDRRAINEFWIAAFPNENTRPARHTMPGSLAGSHLIQLSISAVLNQNS